MAYIFLITNIKNHDKDNTIVYIKISMQQLKIFLKKWFSFSQKTIAFKKQTNLKSFYTKIVTSLKSLSLYSLCFEFVKFSKISCIFICCFLFYSLSRWRIWIWMQKKCSPFCFASGVCHPKTGACLDGCKIGWTGAECFEGLRIKFYNKRTAFRALLAILYLIFWWLMTTRGLNWLS